MAIQTKARKATGRRNDDTPKNSKIPPASQELYSDVGAEEALIAVALLSWEDLAPHAPAVKKDLFTDLAIRKIWKDLAANPTAGILGIKNKDLRLRAARCQEYYSGGTPNTIIPILTEAHDRRILQLAAEKLAHPDNGSSADTWINIKQYVESNTTPPIIEEAKRWTPDALREADFPEPTWLIPNLLPVGLTLLAGRTKIGKSWLALAWGNQIEGGTIYATYEDTARRLKHRTKTLNITGDNPILIPHPPWQMPRALDELAKDIKKYKPAAIIIDPWVCFKPLRRDTKNPIYDVDYETFGMLRRWAEEMKVSVIAIHHSRKPTAGKPGDPLDEPLGSTALTAAVDTAIVLDRKNNTDATLDIRGRDIEPQTLALTFDAGRWTIEGPAAEVIPEGPAADIMALLKETAAHLTPKEIADELSIDHNNVKQILNRMFAKGRVDRNPKGGYTKHVTHVTGADF